MFSLISFTMRTEIAFVLLTLLIGWGHCNAIIKTTRCQFFNGTVCGDGLDCNETEECAPDPEKHASCFVLWQNNTVDGKSFIKLKGCFMGQNADCSGQTRCVSTREPKKDIYFCCCEGNMCNTEFTWEPTPPQSTREVPIVVPDPVSPIHLNTILPFVVVGLAVVIVVVFTYYRQRKGNYFNEVPTSDPHPMPPPSPNMGLRPIQLLEIKATGRFGAVWKAKYKTETVAVKIFPMQDKQSWMAEQQIYKLPGMEHPNILEWVGAERRGENLEMEFWLITAYHENGSLCDYLKANTITWSELSKIAHSMAAGLTHLHEETSGKPGIAHRDFKSKNVLLKSDLSACIADFGLALVFQPGKPCGDTHGQVGTRRYMAPEILEGAINFSRDAFLRIDMYACGLVLWELASRCTAQDGPIGEYRLPFEEEVGLHPTLEDMQESVVHKKQRPILRNDWKSHPGMLALCDTMEECWDHDAEARLSASCVMERIACQAKLVAPPLLINDPNM